MGVNSSQFDNKIYNASYNFNIQEKNKFRLTSDKYEVYLVTTLNGISTYHSLTELYGLESFSWEARDEIKIKKPCTRIEPMAIYENEGFDLDFTFYKENFDNLLTLITDSYMQFYGQNIGVDSERNEYNIFGKPFYTYIDSKESSANEGISMFNSNVKMGVQPLFKIEVYTKSYDIKTELNEDGLLSFGEFKEKKDRKGFRFYNVVLYKPYEKVKSNEFIEYGFKGYSSFMNKIRHEESNYEDEYSKTINDITDEKVNQKREFAEQYFLKRTIKNSSNKDLIDKI